MRTDARIINTSEERDERESAEVFTFQQETLNVLSLFYQRCPLRKRAREGSRTLFGSQNECDSERYLISQCLRRKMCAEIVFERSPGASVWPGCEAPLDEGRM